MAIHFAKSVPKPVARIERAPEAPKAKHAGGRPKSANPKVVLNIRIDAETFAKFKTTGKGWQARINDALKAAKV